MAMALRLSDLSTALRSVARGVAGEMKGYYIGSSFWGKTL
jgi:hypothetical protein